MDALDIFLYAWLGIVVLGLLGFIAWLVLDRGKYKHYYFKVKLTSAKPIAELDRAREIKEKDGTTYWKLLKSKDLINIPPIQAMTPLENGRLFVRAYDLGNMNYRYSREELNAEMQARLLELGETQVLELKRSFIDKIRARLAEVNNASFLRLLFKQPFIKPSPVHIYPQDRYTDDFIKEISKDVINADERQNAYNQVKKAYEKRIKGWQTMILPIIVVISCVVIVSVMFIFGGELVKPMVTINEQVGGMLEKANEITARQAELMRYIAIVAADQQIMLPQGSFNTTGAPN